MSLEETMQQLQNSDLLNSLRTQNSLQRNLLEQVWIALQEDDVDEAKALLEKVFGEQS